MWKHPRCLCKGIILLHDNAHPHTAQVIRETIIKLARETLPPVSYTHLDVYKRQYLFHQARHLIFSHWTKE